MATKEAFQEELNPFEIAKQQFNIAADFLELESSMRRVLENPKRQLIVSIPVKMDGGDVQVLKDTACNTTSRADQRKVESVITRMSRSMR